MNNLNPLKYAAAPPAANGFCGGVLNWRRESGLCSAAKNHTVNLVAFPSVFLLPTESPSFLPSPSSLLQVFYLVSFQ